MISYLKFKQIWNAIENDSLNVEEYLQNVYWRSMLSEAEFKKAVELIALAQQSKTFAEFIAVFDCHYLSFANIFDREIIETERWVQRNSEFSSRLKQTYTFMLLTNHLVHMRHRTCLRCEETFLSASEENYCEFCKPIMERELAKYRDEEKSNESTTIRIELICKSK